MCKRKFYYDIENKEKFLKFAIQTVAGITGSFRIKGRNFVAFDS